MGGFSPVRWNDLLGVVPAQTFERIEMVKNDFWICHACGVWTIWKGDEVGNTIFKTSAMGPTYYQRTPLHTGPRDIVERLVAANKAQFGTHNVKVRGGTLL